MCFPIPAAVLQERMEGSMKRFVVTRNSFVCQASDMTETSIEHIVQLEKQSPHFNHIGPIDYNRDSKLRAHVEKATLVSV